MGLVVNALAAAAAAAACFTFFRTLRHSALRDGPVASATTSSCSCDRGTPAAPCAVAAGRKKEITAAISTSLAGSRTAYPARAASSASSRL